MKINTCTNKHFLRKIEVFIRIRQFLDVYRQSYKSHNFLKISMFSNKKFTFSSSAQLFEKVNISHKISIFFFPKLAFLHKIDVEKNTRHFTPKIARHDFITGGQSISFVGKLLLWFKNIILLIFWTKVSFS